MIYIVAVFKTRIYLCGPAPSTSAEGDVAIMAFDADGERGVRMQMWPILVAKVRNTVSYIGEKQDACFLRSDSSLKAVLIRLIFDKKNRS